MQVGKTSQVLFGYDKHRNYFSPKAESSHVSSLGRGKT